MMPPTLHHRWNFARLRFRLDRFFAYKNWAGRAVGRVGRLMYVINQYHALANSRLLQTDTAWKSWIRIGNHPTRSLCSQLGIG